MFRKNDLILLAVTFGSIGVAIAFPEECRVFSPYPLYFMMVFLFFSFLKIEFFKVLQNVKKTASVLFILCAFKLVLLPAGLYFVALTVWPKYSLPVLLLSGISTGAVAPFIGNLLEASILIVFMMVVVSSLLVPFTLPAMIKFLAGHSVQLSFLSMAKFLAIVIFVPATANMLIRRFSPGLIKTLEAIQFPVSMALFALVNLGIFPRFASFFRGNPHEIGGTLLVAFVLSVIYHFIGFMATWGLRREERLAGAVSFAYINNVLVTVFSAQFFDPLSPLLAVVYMFPFFAMIAPARAVANRFIR